MTQSLYLVTNVLHCSTETAFAAIAYSLSPVTPAIESHNNLYSLLESIKEEFVLPLGGGCPSPLLTKSANWNGVRCYSNAAAKVPHFDNPESRGLQQSYPGNTSEKRDLGATSFSSCVTGDGVVGDGSSLEENPAPLCLPSPLLWNRESAPGSNMCLSPPISPAASPPIPLNPPRDCESS